MITCITDILAATNQAADLHKAWGYVIVVMLLVII